MEKVLISTLYDGDAVKAILGKLSPDKIVFLIDEPKEEVKRKKIKNSLDEIKKFYSGVIVIETIKIETYDLQHIIKTVSEVINKENNARNEILVHITEGRKIASLGLLLAVYMNKDKVKGAYYITEEDHKLITLPLVSLAMGESKKKLLLEVNKGNGAVKRLEQKMNLKPSVIYQHIKELRKEGYLDDEELELTDLGRVMIL